VSSLAGRVHRPRLPVGAVRVGGFGGVEGLRRWLRSHRIDAVVDATHPFAEGMSANAVAACGADGVPLLRLERPGWSEAPGADDWHWVASHDDAASTAQKLGERPFLTVGRQALDRFVPVLGDRDVLVRVVDEPDRPVPDRWTVLLDRGPYELAGESDLMRRHGVDVLVTKDSGGDYTWPKIEAATRLGVPVVVVRRARPPGGTPVVATAPEAVAWVADRLRPA
jgi:precorrin-6A/cobalt-precorrin-6A reductase